MKPLHIAILAALPLAGLVAWQLGGVGAPAGAGAFAGCAVATTIGLTAVVWQERLSVRNSALAINVTLIAFLAKLLALLAGALALRYVPALASRADWSAYLLGFAAAVLWSTACVSIAGAIKLLRHPRTVKERAAS